MDLSRLREQERSRAGEVLALRLGAEVRRVHSPAPPRAPALRRAAVDPLTYAVDLSGPVPPPPVAELFDEDRALERAANRPKRIRRRSTDPVGICGCGRPGNHRGMCGWRWAKRLEGKGARG